MRKLHIPFLHAFHEIKLNQLYSVLRKNIYCKNSLFYVPSWLREDLTFCVYVSWLQLFPCQNQYSWLYIWIALALPTRWYFSIKIIHAKMFWVIEFLSHSRMFHWCDDFIFVKERFRWWPIVHKMLVSTIIVRDGLIDQRLQYWQTSVKLKSCLYSTHFFIIVLCL